MLVILGRSPFRFSKTHPTASEDELDLRWLEESLGLDMGWYFHAVA